MITIVFWISLITFSINPETAVTFTCHFNQVVLQWYIIEPKSSGYVQYWYLSDMSMIFEWYVNVQYSVFERYVDAIPNKASSSLHFPKIFAEHLNARLLILQCLFLVGEVLRCYVVTLTSITLKNAICHQYYSDTSGLIVSYRGQQTAASSNKMRTEN